MVAAREAQAARSKRGAGIVSGREEAVHMIRGLEFFQWLSERDLVEAALADIEEAATLLHPDELADRALKTGIGSVREGLDGLLWFLRLHVAARQALSPTSFEGIIRWQHGPGPTKPIIKRQGMLTADHGEPQPVRSPCPRSLR
jgi:hypothetical protein